MKIIARALLISLVLSFWPAHAQNPPPPVPVPAGPPQVSPTPPPGAPGASFRERVAAIVNRAGGETAVPLEPEPVIKFDLDFPGGRPGDLVSAIEKASGHPLNAIIPDEYRDLSIPALRMRNVTVPALFEALQAASIKQEARLSGNLLMVGPGRSQRQYSYYQTSYGFRTQGTPRHDSVWYFFCDRPAELPPDETPPNQVCRFFQLAPYLQSHTVEDITTAIQTGWEMLGEGRPPKLSYHKDTMLLIAVGDPDKLQMINDVLEALAPAGPSGRRPPPRAPVPVPTAAPETSN